MAGAASSGSSIGGGAANARRVLKRESSLYILPELLQRRSAELGGLELEELIGRGSFGRVYRGACSVMYNRVNPRIANPPQQ